RLVVDEAPDVLVEAAELPLHREEGGGIGDTGLDLEAVPHDPGIFHQRCDLLPAETRHRARIQTREGFAIGLQLSQYGAPAQTGLRAFEDQKLEEAPVVVHRYTPLGVVIGGLQRVAFGPVATFSHSRILRHAIIAGYENSGITAPARRHVSGRTSSGGARRWRQPSRACGPGSTATRRGVRRPVVW